MYLTGFWFPLLGILLYFNNCLAVSKVPLLPEEKIYHDVISGRSKVRPVREWENPLSIYVGFFLQQIIGLNTKDQVLTVVGSLFMNWQSDTFKWNASKYEGLDHVFVLAEDIWIPDVGVGNSINKFLDDKWRKIFRARIQSDGTIFFIIQDLFETSCSVDMTYFPYDSQFCQISFTNRIYTADLVQLKTYSDELDMSFYSESNEWDVVQNASETTFSPYYYQDREILFSVIHFRLCIRRKFIYYIMTLVSPCVLLSALSLLVFCLPSDSGEKISLGVTVLLSYVVFLLLFTELMPQTSVNIPYMSIYLLLIMVVTAASMVVTVFVLNCHHKAPGLEMPRWVRFIVFQVIARLMCKCRAGRIVSRSTKIKPLCQQDNKMAMEEKDLINLELNEDTQLQEKQGHMLSEKFYKVLFEIKEHVEAISKSQQSSGEEDAKLAEWKMAARVLDRFFFIFSLLSVIGVTSTLMGLFPLMNSFNQQCFEA